MPEPTDAILPILQRIQPDLADLKRDVADLKRETAEVHAVLDDHTRRLSEMNGFLSFSLNVTTRHSTEIDVLRDDISALKRRVATLENR